MSPIGWVVTTVVYLVAVSLLLFRLTRAEGALAAEKRYTGYLRETLEREQRYIGALREQIAALEAGRETLIGEILTLKREGYEVDPQLSAIRNDESWASYHMDDVKSEAPRAEVVEVLL